MTQRSVTVLFLSLACVAMMSACSHDSISGDGSFTDDMIVLGGMSEDLVTSESGTSVTFTVSLAAKPSSDIELVVASENPREGSVSPAALTFSAKNWNSPQTVTVTGVGDDIVDGDQTYYVTVSYYVEATNSDGTQKLVAQQKISITNKDIDVADLRIHSEDELVTSEDGTSISFDVTLASRPMADVVVAVASTNEAEGLPDVSSLIFTENSWNIPQTITVTGIDDDIVDGDVAYAILLTATSGDANYQNVSKRVDLINRDNDSLGVRLFDAEGLETDEDGAQATFGVALASRPLENIVVPIASDNENEGVTDVSELVFTPENWNVSQIVTVTGVQDGLFDGDQIYHVIVGASDMVPVLNRDTTRAGIALGSPGPFITSESGDQARLEIRLSGKPASKVTLNFDSDNHAEGVVDKKTLEFTPDNWNVYQTVTVTGVDDDIVDGNIVYHIVFDPIISDDVRYKGLVLDKIAITNLDNDMPGLSIITTNFGDVDESGTTTSFSVILNTRPSGEVFITLLNGDESEIAIDPTILRFDETNWHIPVEVTVTGLPDDIDDGDQIVSISFALASVDADYDKLAIDPIFVKNINIDESGILLAHDGDVLRTVENGAPVTFTVVLTSKPTADVLVRFESNDITEGTVTPGPFTFTAANWNVPQIVTITPIDDMVADGDITYAILTTVSSGDANYNGLVIKPLTVINEDDEVASVVVTPTHLTFVSTGQKATFSVVLSAEPLNSVSFNLTSSDPLLGTIDLSHVTFTPVNWNIPQIITVTAGTVLPETKTFQIETSKTSSVSPVYHNLDVADVIVNNILFTTTNFNYTGTVQAITLYPATYKFEVWGAQGGRVTENSPAVEGGRGGYSEGHLTLTEVTTLFVSVGKHGDKTSNSCAVSDAGWNGGGRIAYNCHGGAGGGATDIALLGVAGSTAWNTPEHLHSRLIVAGGGGGLDYDHSTTLRCGAGGGTNGTDGRNTSGAIVMGGKISGPGAGGASQGNTAGFGYGASDASNGGGGWFGGAADRDTSCGGGGSGWVFTKENAAYTSATYTGGAWLADDKFQLINAKTLDGTQTFLSPAGVSGIGHLGSGHARISLVTE